MVFPADPGPEAASGRPRALALQPLLGFTEVDVAARQRLEDLDAVAGGWRWWVAPLSSPSFASSASKRSLAVG
jgi:hypothetical protein